eukprot:GILI01000753.1.p1 GENE.GILI01000753.1~~GILI01000753.1.p1  ORF type:complete len:700 (+),score=230.87 GILI01000753.1:99-2102(+)
MPVNLSWEDLSYSIGGKEILSHMSGRMIAGRSCGLMGASGSGKTTLLNALSGRLGSSGNRVLKGRVRLNDVPYDRRFRQLIGFVPQDDIIGPMSTPRTAFNFALRTRRGVSTEEAEVTVQKYIERLKLIDCRNTIVGIPGVVQGLSGGERKRTNIGMELISDTKLLLCDEPTSGLDSTTALMVVRTLQELAHDEGCTVMFTVHQPTTDMLAHFDDLLLLCEGKVVYHGPMDKSVDYFESIGYVCPENFTPTDFYMVLLQNEEIAPQLLAKWQEFLELNEVTVQSARSPMNVEPQASPENVTSRNEPADSEMPPIEERRAHTGEALTVKRVDTVDMASGDTFKYILGDETPLNVLPYPATAHPHHNNATNDYLKRHLAESGSGYWIQSVELFRRAFIFVYTDVSYLAMMIISHLFFAVIVAIIFNNLTDNFTGIQDRVGLLFMCAVNVCFSHANFALNRFRSGKLLYVREQQVGAYSPFLYFIANFIADIPIIALSLLLETIIVYLATDLHRSGAAFFYFFAVLLCCSMASFGLGALVGSAFSNEVIAVSIVPMVQIPMLMCGGLLADNDQVRPYFIWMEKISMHRYGALLLFHNEFRDLGELSCDAQKFGAITCSLVPKRGSEVMAYLGFDDEQDSEWVLWLTMAVFIFLVRFGQLIALYVISRSKS